MNQELKCLKNSETNAYIIPTNKWLQPLKQLITNSSDATNIISRMVDKEKILVRLTNNKNNKLGLINKKLSKLPGFPLVYCTIICQESSDIIDADYIINGEPAKGFCNGKSTDNYVTLELMKYYKSNKLNDILQSPINLNLLRYFLDQALCSQLLAFQYYGFVHNDININNFIIEQQKESILYSYEFDKRIGFKKITGKVNFNVYVIDFGLAELLNPQYRTQYLDDYYINTKYPSLPKITNPKYINKTNTLPFNIIETIFAFLRLCPDHEINIGKINNIQIQSNPILDFYNYHFNRYYYTMCTSSNNFDTFMIKSLDQTIRMVNEIYGVLFGEQFAELDL